MSEDTLSVPNGTPSHDDILTVFGGEIGLPLGMTLNGPMRAKRLADGRLFLFELPHDLLVLLYPDIARDSEPVDVAESTPAPIEPEPSATNETADTPPSEPLPDAPTIAEVN